MKTKIKTTILLVVTLISPVFMGFRTAEGTASIFQLVKAPPIIACAILCTVIGLLIPIEVYFKNRHVYRVIRLLKQSQYGSETRAIKALKEGDGDVRAIAAKTLGLFDSVDADDPLKKP